MARTCKERADLQKIAKPQSGVDDLKGKFGRPTRDIPGVVNKENKQQCAREVNMGLL